MGWLIRRPPLTGPFYYGQRIDGRDVYRSLRTKIESEAYKIVEGMSSIKSMEETQETPLAAEIQAFMKALQGLADHTIYLHNWSFNYVNAHFKDLNELKNVKKCQEFRDVMNSPAFPASSPVSQGMILRHIRKFLAFKGCLSMELKRVLKSPPEISKGRFLTPEEERQVLDCSGPDLKRFIIIKLETGLRVSQVWGLTWGQVQGDYLYVLPQKRQKTRYVPLTARARLAIGPRPEEALDTDRVFLNWRSVNGPKHAFSRAVNRARKKYGFTGRLRPHDCKHTCTSRLLEDKNLTSIQVRDFMGWSTVALVDRYGHSNLRDIAKKLGVDSPAPIIPTGTNESFMRPLRPQSSRTVEAPNLTNDTTPL